MGADTKNYLKEVIVRIDFATELEFTDNELPKELEKLIINLFPIKEPKKIIGMEFILKAPESKSSKDKKPKSKSPESVEVVDVKDLERKEWHFFGKDREKRLRVTDKFLSIYYKEYNTFEHLKEDFLPVISKLFSTFDDIQVNRLGLRYINNISLDDIERDKWKNHISEKLLYIFDIPPKTEIDKISRGFNSVTLNYGDMKFHFQFGISNPDFPAPIKRNIFILDYDSFIEDLLEEKDIIENLESFHDKIKEFFSMSIPEGRD